MRRGSLVVGLAALAAALLVGCGGTQTKSGGPSSGGAAAVSLNGAGASFPYPLYSRWFSEYNKVAPGVKISYQSIGSGGGIQAMQNRTVDFGASDAPFSDDEAKAMPAPVLHFPTVAGAVAVIYNLPGLKQALRLDGTTLAGIYLGEIKTWNDAKLAALNPGVTLPATPVTVAHRSDGSGTSYLFTSYLAAVSPAWKQEVGAGKSVKWPAGLGGKGSEGVAGIVKQGPGAIGYVELAYAKQNGLASAELRNAAGEFVAPTTGGATAAAGGAAEKMKQDMRVSIINSSAAGAYPISGFTYLLLYQDQSDRTKGEALAQFLAWAIGDGQWQAEPLGYAPLPSAVAKLDQALLASLTAKGAPLGASK